MGNIIKTCKKLFPLKEWVVKNLANITPSISRMVVEIRDIYSEKIKGLNKYIYQLLIKSLDLLK
jgi:hypothetical protein